MNTRVVTVALLSALAAGGGCGNQLSLDVGAEPEDDRFDAIRRRLAITIEPGSSGSEGPSTCNVDGCDPGAFSVLLVSGCADALEESGRTFVAPDDCADHVINAELYICVAQTLLQVIDSPSTMELDYGGQGASTVRIPPQDAESNSELARFALIWSVAALRIVANALDPTRSACIHAQLNDDAGAAEPLASLSLGEELAHFYTEALDIARTAGERMAESGAAVSDAAYSRRTDAAEGSADALAPFASRTAAAHMLVGGAYGLPAIEGVAEEGFFTRPRLSGEAQRAIELIRAAGIDPDLVRDTSDTGPSIGDLVLGAGSVAPADSIRFRLGHMQSRQSLLDATTADAVYYRLGATRDAFVEARAYLREELRAFDRSSAAELPEETLPDGTTTTSLGIVLYGATRSPPRQLHPSYWAAVLRYDPTPNPVYTGAVAMAPFSPWAHYPDAEGDVAPGDTWGDEAEPTPWKWGYVSGERTVASVVDEGYFPISTFLEYLCPSAVCADARYEAARDVFVGVLADAHPDPRIDGTLPEARYGNASHLGRARACVSVEDGDDTDFDVIVEVSQIDGLAGADIQLVSGRDGLSCAVDGRLETDFCDDAQFSALLLGSGFTLVPNVSTGIPAWTDTALSLSLASRPAPETMTLFVVRRRAGITGPALPGQYEELTGFVLPKPDSPTTLGYRYCAGAIISPQFDRMAGALIQPSTAPPHRPAESCVGLPSDLRIPLENELTSDAGGAPSVENSWRHYLTLAQSSANAADQLGEDLIRTGMEMDLRAEAASDELSRLCGVSINVSAIADTIETLPDRVIPPGPMGCALPYVTEGTQCALDPVLYAADRAVRDRDDDMNRLAGCLGVDLVPWATLGDTELCIWDNNAGEGGICEGRPAGSSPNEMPCPYVADAMNNCDGPQPDGATPILVDELVGIFMRPAIISPPPPDPNDLPCEALAEYRAEGSTSWEGSERLIRLMTYEGIQPLANRLSWEGGLGDYSMVRYGGSIAFGTGTVADVTPTPLWPMGVAPTGACPSGSTPGSDPRAHTGPLFCLQNVAMAPVPRLARARTNDLLARAVLAMRVFTGGSLHNLRVPYYPFNFAWQYHVTPDSFDWALVPGSNPSAFSASTGRLTVDHREFDEANSYQLEAGDLGSSFGSVAGSGGTAGSSCTIIPSTAEWSLCPYRGAPAGYPAGADCFVFDDGLDCDDAFLAPIGTLSGDERDAPFVIREVDRALASNEGGVHAVRLWGERLSFLLFEASAFTDAELDAPLLPGEIQNLTNYFDTGEEGGLSSCDLAEYEDCVEGASHRRLLAEGNRAFIARDGLTVNDFLNGLELACWAAKERVPIEDTSCAEPGDIQTLSDAYRMRGYLECRANEISSFGSASLVQDLPRRVVEALRRDGSGTYGGGSGEFDAQVRELRAALIELGNHRLDMAADIRAFSARIRSLDSAVSMSERGREIERLALFGRSFERVTQCITAAARAVGMDPAAAAGGAIAATAACVNTGVQVSLDRAASRLRAANVDDAIIDEFARFTGEATDFGRRMSVRSNALRASLERIDASISRMRITQTAARRALARALMLDSDGTAAHFAVNSAYRARYNTLLERYRESHQRALRAAFIARLALEQRIGMPLADIEDDIFSDEPPSEWVDTLCTLPSIDYDRVRSASPGPTGERDSDTTELPVPAGYSGAYVGDYVRRLEQVFESYSFVYPFREGTDTTVISLRDDIFRSRAPCDIPSPNLLDNAGRLDVFASSDRLGWSVEGCDVAAGTGTDRQCLSVVRLDGDDTDNPLSLADGRFSRPVPYRLDFGLSPVTTATTALEQTVRLPAGRYRLSFWMKEADWGVRVEDGATALVSFSINTIFFVGDTVNGWERRWAFFDIPSERDVRVVIPMEIDGVSLTSLHVAGVMLEDVTGSVIGDVARLVDIVEGDESVTMGVVYGQRAEPGPFFGSGDAGLSTLRACIDETGQYFRRESWERGCVRVCADGYDGNCPPELADSRCYWQTSFGISSDTLSNLLVAGDAGFAAGNHNYRIESVAVNLVGTGLRDCTGRGSSGCFASGAFSYSMNHLGPYLVRNARGSLYDAPLFPGRLESARALAAERYLTNPISTSDRSLLDPYTRYELQGRPLGGSLILRLWDDSSFRFDRLEDVQVALTYRYWQYQR